MFNIKKNIWDLDWCTQDKIKSKIFKKSKSNVDLIW